MEGPVVRNAAMTVTTADGQHCLTARHNPRLPEPLPHPQWRLQKVISGHTGWVRSIAIDGASNSWFATGAADRTIKIWDFPSGTLKLTLTGHISTVRAVAVSERHPYLFSAGEDRKVLCWDLEQNKVVRHFHGHYHGVYSMALHPRLDVLVTGSRDGSARVWDMRTKMTVHLLAGHRSTVSALLASESDPQVITASMDSEVRLWDLATGKTRISLTHHKKAVRALAAPSFDWTFISGAADSCKRFALPDGIFLNNYDLNHERNRAAAVSESIVNCVAVNDDGVVFAGGDDGSMRFWDYRSGHCFQRDQAVAQPGSMDCEAGVLAATFDRTGMRLITAEVDKTIKIWGEVLPEAQE